NSRSGRRRIGKQYQTNLLIRSDRQTRRTQLCENAICLGGRKKINLHWRIGKLGRKLLPARRIAIGGSIDMCWDRAKREEYVCELTVWRHAAWRIAQRNLNHAGGGCLH